TPPTNHGPIFHARWFAPPRLWIGLRATSSNPATGPHPPQTDAGMLERIAPRHDVRTFRHDGDGHDTTRETSRGPHACRRPGTRLHVQPFWGIANRPRALPAADVGMGARAGRNRSHPGADPGDRIRRRGGDSSPDRR